MKKITLELEEHEIALILLILAWSIDNAKKMPDVSGVSLNYFLSTSMQDLENKLKDATTS